MQKKISIFRENRKIIVRVMKRIQKINFYSIQFLISTKRLVDSDIQNSWLNYLNKF